MSKENKFDRASTIRGSKHTSETPNKEENKNESEAPSKEDENKNEQNESNKEQYNDLENKNEFQQTGKENSNDDNTNEKPAGMEQVNVEGKITIEEGKVTNNTQIIKVDRHDTIKKLVKKSKEKNPVNEILEVFPNMKLNQIVAHFVEEIEECRLKEMKRRYINSSKSKAFKDEMETFSIPVRSEMKELLKILDAFYSINKYILFENLLLELFKSHDFDKDLSEDED